MMLKLGDEVKCKQHGLECMNGKPGIVQRVIGESSVYVFNENGDKIGTRDQNGLVRIGKDKHILSKLCWCDPIVENHTNPSEPEANAGNRTK